MNRMILSGAAALTIMGGAAIFSAPASAITISHGEYVGGALSAKLTDVGWRRYYYRRHVLPPAYAYYGYDYYGPPAYYEPHAYYGPPPVYYDYGPGAAVYDPEFGVSVGIE